jgi:hypothetical protein
LSFCSFSDKSEPKDRIERFGQWGGQIGENIHFDSLNAKFIVMNLLIDDGAADRNHRSNLLNPEFRFVGGVIGPHDKHNSSCVMTFASSIIDILHIETHPRSLMLPAGSPISQEFAKAIKSIPGETDYYKMVAKELKEGAEVSP